MRPREAPSPEARDDGALVERCRRGDRTAQDRVLRIEIEPLERFLSKLVRSQADLEDLVQQTLARAVIAFPAFRGESTVRTWLFRIGTRIALDESRGARRRDAAHRRLALVETPEEPSRPDEELAAHETWQRVQTILDDLSAAQRVAFVFHVIDGRSVAEVAALTGATRIATRVRVFLARRLIETRLRADPPLATALSNRRKR